MHQMPRDVTGIARDCERRADVRENTQRNPGNCFQASPPARSASDGFGCGPEPRPSILLYHESSHATAIIAKIPNALINICIPTDREISEVTKCPRNERKIPRQKISSECWPHRIIGLRIGDFSPGQSAGMKRTVITESATKCAKRSTSMLVLSIGYIQSWNHFGM